VHNVCKYCIYCMLFALWLCIGCHHQKGGVCKGKVSDNIRSQVSMMTNDHHACLQTNATHHRSYPFLCLSKSVIILKNICGQSVIMTKCMKITKHKFLQIWRLWVDHKGRRIAHGSAHNSDKLEIGQHMLAWVDHKGRRIAHGLAHKTLESTTGRRMA
jgi:hypothetical protein